jgi:Ca2+-binding EF-hand superfamily protein
MVDNSDLSFASPECVEVTNTMFDLVLQDKEKAISAENLGRFYDSLGAKYSPDDINQMMAEFANLQTDSFDRKAFAQTYNPKRMAAAGFEASFTVMQNANAFDSPQALQAFFAKIGEPLALEEAASMIECAHLYSQATDNTE